MKCGQTCEVYSRVVGYHRPVANWNKGKREEFKERVEFKESISLNNACCKQEAAVEAMAPEYTKAGASDFF